MQEVTAIPSTKENQAEQPITIDFRDRHEMTRQASELLLEQVNQLLEFVSNKEKVAEHLSEIGTIANKINGLYESFRKLNKVDDYMPEQMKQLIDSIVNTLKKSDVEIKSSEHAIRGLRFDGLLNQEVQELISFYHDIGNDIARIVGMAQVLEFAGDDQLLLDALQSTPRGLKDKLENHLDQDQDHKTNAGAFLDVAAALTDEMKLYAQEVDIQFAFHDADQLDQAVIQQHQVDFHPVALRDAYMNALQNVLRINKARAESQKAPAITQMFIQVRLIEVGEQPMIIITIDDNGTGFPETLKEKAESFMDDRAIDVYKPEMGKTSYSDTVKGTGVALVSLESKLRELGGDLVLGNVHQENGQMQGARVELHIPMNKAQQPAEV